ncbi:MAG: hypothetical protein ABT15_04205 [Pseudonocardia sp. SCN 73-27]|nr:MAG: hypothetical protein ABT15_04205 [Pseudonocardia sp. SCN 73-27]
MLERQHGMASLTQLQELGISWSAVVAQTKAGRWRRHLPRVYATFTGPLPRAASISAALLYGGAHAVLSHRTAAEEWGLVRHEDGPIHVTVPYGTSAISQPGLVVVHRSRAFHHIVVASDPPRTSPGDTAIDLAAAETDAVQARRTLVALLTTGRVGPDRLRQRLLERPPRRHRRALSDAVALVRDGVQSALEELYASDVEGAHGLPTGRRQTPMSVDGFTLYEDVTYDHAGADVTIRLDGRTHLAEGTSFRDRRRDNAAELAGRARLVYGWMDLSSDPCAAAREVATVLTRRGWSGRPTRCPRCR